MRKNLFQTILVLTLVPALAFAQVAAPVTNKDLELVQKYVRSRESVVGRSIYAGLQNLIFLPSGVSLMFKRTATTVPAGEALRIGYDGQKIIWPQLSVFDSVFLVMGLYLAVTSVTYLISGGRKAANLGLQSNLNSELGIDDEAHRQKQAQLTPEEMVRVDQILRSRRSYLYRFFNAFFAFYGLEQIAGMTKVPAIINLANLTSVYMFFETVVFTATKGRIGGLNKFIDRTLGFPTDQDMMRAEAKLKHVARLPTAQAQAMIDQDPETQQVVEYAAKMIRTQLLR